jgi:hypothetical protein
MEGGPDATSAGALHSNFPMQRDPPSADLRDILEHAFEGGILIDPWRRGHARPVSFHSRALQVHILLFDVHASGHVNAAPTGESWHRAA